jgi:hypothetical protein
MSRKETTQSRATKAALQRGEDVQCGPPGPAQGHRTVVDFSPRREKGRKQARACLSAVLVSRFGLVRGGWRMHASSWLLRLVSTCCSYSVPRAESEQQQVERVT